MPDNCIGCPHIWKGEWGEGIMQRWFLDCCAGDLALLLVGVSVGDLPEKVAPPAGCPQRKEQADGCA